MQNPEDKVKSSIRLEQNDCELSIIVDVDIVDGWHINSHVLPEESFSIPSNILLNKSSNYTVSRLIEPKPIIEYDEEAEGGSDDESPAPKPTMAALDNDCI